VLLFPTLSGQALHRRLDYRWMELADLCRFTLHCRSGEAHHAGPAHGIFSCNGGQRHPAAAVMGEGLMVYVERCPAKPEAFESPSGHPLADTLTSQSTLKLADAPNQGQKEPPRRRSEEHTSELQSLTN